MSDIVDDAKFLMLKSDVYDCPTMHRLVDDVIRLRAELAEVKNGRLGTIEEVAKLRAELSTIRAETWREAIEAMTAELAANGEHQAIAAIRALPEPKP